MLHLIAIFSLIRQAWTYDWPTPTLPASNGFSFDGWSPKPTSQVGLVEKRQDTPSTICGYVGGIASKSARTTYTRTFPLTLLELSRWIVGQGTHAAITQ